MQPKAFARRAQTERQTISPACGVSGYGFERGPSKGFDPAMPEMPSSCSALAVVGLQLGIRDGPVAQVGARDGPEYRPLPKIIRVESPIISSEMYSSRPPTRRPVIPPARPHFRPGRAGTVRNVFGCKWWLFVRPLRQADADLIVTKVGRLQPGSLFEDNDAEAGRGEFFRHDTARCAGTNYKKVHRVDDLVHQCALPCAS